MKLPLFKLRSSLVMQLFGLAQPIYDRIHPSKKETWTLTTKDLLRYPQQSLARKIGEFHKKNGFTFLPTHEVHDVYHVVLNIGTTSLEEGALQWALLGNGKRSAFAFLASFGALIILPEGIKTFYSHYHLGKSLAKFHDRNFLPELDEPFSRIQKQIQKCESQVATR